MVVKKVFDMSIPTKIEIIRDINDYLKQCDTKPQLVQFIKKKYGLNKNRKFESFGYGKIAGFIKECSIFFNASRPPIANPTEEELIELTRLSYQRNGVLNYVLNDIRKLYGNCPFSQFGFGTFNEFCDRNQHQIYDLSKNISRDSSPQRFPKLVNEPDESVLFELVRKSVAMRSTGDSPQYELFPTSAPSDIVSPQLHQQTSFFSQDNFLKPKKYISKRF
jgi:hypothetical protein